MKKYILDEMELISHYTKKLEAQIENPYDEVARDNMQAVELRNEAERQVYNDKAND